SLFHRPKINCRPPPDNRSLPPGCLMPLNFSSINNVIDGLRARTFEFFSRQGLASPHRTLSSRRWPWHHYFQRRQRRWRDRHLHTSRQRLRLHPALVSRSHDHRTLCHRRDVRSDGGHHRQRPLRPHPRGIRFPPHFLRYDHRFPRGFVQCRRRICWGRRVHGTVWNQPVFCRSCCRCPCLVLGFERDLSSSRNHFPDLVRLLFELSLFGAAL